MVAINVHANFISLMCSYFVWFLYFGSGWTHALAKAYKIIITVNSSSISANN